MLHEARDRHEAKDRQKFVSDVEYLRDMQHKTDSEYQACLRRQEYKRDEKKRDQLGVQETNLERSRFSSGSSSKQSSGEEDLVVESKSSVENAALKCNAKLPAIDPKSVKQKHKSGMTPGNLEKAGPSKTSPGDSSEHPLFCVEYTPYCSVFALTPVQQPNTSNCSLLLPLVTPVPSAPQVPPPPSPGASLATFSSPTAAVPTATNLGSSGEHPTTLYYFPVSCPPPSQIPVLCLPSSRRPSRIYLVCSPGNTDFIKEEKTKPGTNDSQSRNAGSQSIWGQKQTETAAANEDSVVQQESPKRTNEMKKPTWERRNLVPFSEKMIKTRSLPQRTKKGDPSALSQNEPPSGLPQSCQGTNCPQGLSESLGAPLTATAMRESRRAPFRFRDEDFYSMLPLNTGEDDDTEEEIHEEEELLLVGMHSPHSSFSQKRSRFLGASATLTKKKVCEENPANCGTNSRQSELSHDSLRASSAVQAVKEQPPAEQRMFPGLQLSCEDSAKEGDGGDGGNERKNLHSWDAKSEHSLDEDLNTENVSSGYASVEDRPRTHDYQRDWQAYLSSSSRSLDYFLSGRPPRPRPSIHSPYNLPGPLVHSPLSGDIPVDLSRSSTSSYSSDSEGNPRFNVRRPLSPIRNRDSLASAENQSCFPENNAHECDVSREDTTVTSPSPGTQLYTQGLLLNPQSGLSLMESSGSSLSTVNLQDPLHVSRSLQENIPSFTFFAVSDFPSQSNHGSRLSLSAFLDEKEATKIKADPEKLKKLQASLLEEDSEEEENLCRICQIAGGSPANPLLEPCGCVGSLQFVHQECLKKWLKVKITSGADLSAVKTCEMCKKDLLVDLKDFDLTEFYQKHQQSRAQNELMNSGLYLVLLLHLYEQRFAELMRLNNHRVARVRLSRSYPQPRPEENENSELGEEN